MPTQQISFICIFYSGDEPMEPAITMYFRSVEVQCHGTYQSRC